MSPFKKGVPYTPSGPYRDVSYLMGGATRSYPHRYSPKLATVPCFGNRIDIIILKHAYYSLYYSQKLTKKTKKRE